MRRPVALFVGLRYLKASKGSGFVSFVNAASVLGVALGVAALIVVMSVMNGFENELRGRLLGLTSHASVYAAGGVDDWQQVVSALDAEPGIKAAAPYTELEAMLSGPGGMTAAVLTAVEPDYEKQVSQIAASMLIGRLNDLDGGGRVVLGRALAQKLGVSVNSVVTVLIPLPVADSTRVDSRLVSFEVAGIFELGVQDHDSVRALVHINDTDELLDLGGAVTGVRVETADIFSAPVVVRSALVNSGLADGLQVRDWTQENASYFRAIRLEKTMMALLLSLIIGVAAFNIVAMLVMVVTEKRSGIAILRTLGCSEREVVAIFLLQGTVLGWCGALVGVALGVWLSLNVGTLAPLLEQVFGFNFMPADLYYLTALPSDLQLYDVLLASLGVLMITALATLYPALRAAHVHPAEVLRYE